MHLSLLYHLLLIIPISIDYGPWLGNDGVIFFKEKIRCIPVRFSEVELRLIALNAELQVFQPFSNNNVPNPHVDCVEHVNFVESRQMVELALKRKQVQAFEVCVVVSGYCLETDYTENQHNPSQRTITELMHLSLLYHLLLIIPISIDYGPWLGNDGVIFFKEKIRRIPVRFSEVELRLIALNAELQVFQPFSNNNVPNPHVDCVEHVNFVESRQMVELALKRKQVQAFEVCVVVSGYCLETDYTENQHVRSDCTMIRGGTVSVDVEFLALKPPMRNTMGCTNIVKENQEKDKIGSKLDKNRKRVEAGKSLKQLQWVEEEKLNKTQKNGRKCKRSQKLFKYLKKEEKKGVKSANSRKYNHRGHYCLLLKVVWPRTVLAIALNTLGDYSCYISKLVTSQGLTQLVLVKPQGRNV
nr:hypothetical protein [Tanacetum cinerariifolium]